jgi:CO/xanthine dehydrogenase FAD-binding subunit
LRVALTAVAPTIIEVTGLTGGSVAAAVAAARDAASQQARPISDLRASDDYRRHTVGVMAGRAVEAAARRAGGEHIASPLNRAVGIGATS